MKNRIFCLLLVAATAACAQTPLDLLKEASERPRLSLSDFETFALASNPTLQQAAALTRESAARAAQAALLPNPTIGYQGEHIRGGSFGGGEQGAFLQQDIVLGGKPGLRKNVYRQQGRSDEIGAREQRSRVLSGIGQQFYSALAAQEAVTLRRDLLDIAGKTVETAHQLANIGQADEPDILQAEVEADQTSIDYTTAQRQYIAEFDGLAAASGKPDLPLAALAGSLETVPTIDTDHIIDTILRDSPSLKRAQQDVLSAEAEWKAAKRESVPDLQLRGGLEQANELLVAGQPNRVVGLEGFATAGVTLPLFNRNQGNIAAAQAAIERARAEVTRVELSLRQTANKFLEQYLARRDEAALYRDRMIPRAKRAYELYLNKYNHMAAAYPQVLIAQRTLFQLQVSYIEVLKNLWTASVALQNYTVSDPLNAVASSSSSR